MFRVGPTIFSTRCYICPPGTICSCPATPINISCANAKCGASIHRSSIILARAYCHCCKSATCTLCLKPFHLPNRHCPAEPTDSGIISKIKVDFQDDMAAMDLRDAALHRVYVEAVRENQSVIWGVADVRYALLKKQRRKLDADRAKTVTLLDKLRKERIERYVQELQQAEEADEQNMRDIMTMAPMFYASRRGNHDCHVWSSCCGYAYGI